MVKWMVAIRQLWRRQIEMYLALQLQEVVEQGNPSYMSMKPLRPAACANTPTVPSPSE